MGQSPGAEAEDRGRLETGELKNLISKSQIHPMLNVVSDVESVIEKVT